MPCRFEMLSSIRRWVQFDAVHFRVSFSSPLTRQEVVNKITHNGNRYLTSGNLHTQPSSALSANGKSMTCSEELSGTKGKRSTKTGEDQNKISDYQGQRSGMVTVRTELAGITIMLQFTSRQEGIFPRNQSLENTESGIPPPSAPLLPSPPPLLPYTPHFLPSPFPCASPGLPTFSPLPLLHSFTICHVSIFLSHTFCINLWPLLQPNHCRSKKTPSPVHVVLRDA